MGKVFATLRMVRVLNSSQPVDHSDPSAQAGVHVFAEGLLKHVHGASPLITPLMQILTFVKLLIVFQRFKACGQPVLPAVSRAHPAWWARWNKFFLLLRI